MSVTLLRAYGNFANAAVVTLPDSVESALIAQGLAVAANVTAMSIFPEGTIQNVAQGGSRSLVPHGEQGYGTPAYRQGPSILPNIALGSLALTSYETAGVAQVAGTWNLSEIFVPHINTWAGAGALNGTTVGTDKYTFALFGSDGTLLANTAPAGVLTAGASVMQNIAFTSPITLVPGRYFIGVQLNGTTDTVRHVLAANGSNVIGGTQAGAAGTVPASITTVPSTFTTAVAPICQLYT